MYRAIDLLSSEIYDLQPRSLDIAAVIRNRLWVRIEQKPPGWESSANFGNAPGLVH